MTYPVAIALALALLCSLLANRTAEGQVPTAADIASCNEEAPHAVKAGGTSPIKGDHARAERARDGATATSPAEPAGKPVESPDPQIHGMAAEGAKSAAYQAAYRSCMRRKGF